MTKQQVQYLSVVLVQARGADTIRDVIGAAIDVVLLATDANKKCSRRERRGRNKVFATLCSLYDTLDDVDE